MERYIGNSELTIGEKLNQLRKDKNFTLEQVEKFAQISKSTISNYENESTSPTYENLRKLLKVYDVSPQEFFGLDLVRYERDLEVFKAYGLNETVYRELVMSAKYRQNNEIADCINLIFDYPLYAFKLFRELDKFFNPIYYKEIDPLLKDYPQDGTQRVLLEPVIYILIKIFNAKNAEVLCEHYQNEAEQQQKIHAQIVQTARENEEIL